MYKIHVTGVPQYLGDVIDNFRKDTSCYVCSTCYEDSIPLRTNQEIYTHFLFQMPFANGTYSLYVANET